MAGPKVKQNLGKYWWVAILLLLLIGGWTAYPLLNKSSADLGVEDIGPNAVAMTDLNGLSDGLSPEASAPGQAYGAGGARGGDRKDNIAMLKGAPRPSGSKNSAAGAAEAAKKAAAEAAARASARGSARGSGGGRSGKGEGEGEDAWHPRSAGSEEGAAASSGGKFSPMSLDIGGGGGGGGPSGPLSGGAEDASKGTPFFGKREGDLDIPSGNLKPGAGGGPDLAPVQTQAALGKLNDTAAANQNALKLGAEEAAHAAGGKTFGEGSGAGGVGPKAGEGALAQLQNGADTPTGLRGPPAPPPGKEIQPPNPQQTKPAEQDFWSKLLDTLTGLAIQNMMGPIFSGVGNGLTRGMGMDPDNYQGQKPQATDTQPAPAPTQGS